MFSPYLPSHGVVFMKSFERIAAALILAVLATSPALAQTADAGRGEVPLTVPKGMTPTCLHR